MHAARWWLLAGTAAFVVAATACGSKPATPAPAATAAEVFQGNATHGQELFLGTCATCHGQDARGLPGLGKNLVTSAFVHSKTDPEMLDFLHKGRPTSDPLNTTRVEMPPKGGNPSLSDDDLKDIIAYLRTINKGQ